MQIAYIEQAWASSEQEGRGKNVWKISHIQHLRPLRGGFRKSYQKVKQHGIIMDFVMDIDKLNPANLVGKVM